jgi:bacteriorhodopsin
MDYLIASSYGSLAIQLITGLIEASGLFFNVKSEDTIVRDILAMELIVQAIEFMFYIYLVYLIITVGITSDITSHRYVDWALTTPVMLISFVIFFKYLRDPTRNIRLWESIQEEQGNIIKLVIANALMLLLGFLGERKIINPYVGITLGFLPFAYAFKILYCEYATHTELARTLFYIAFVIWGLYGVAAVLPFAPKNTFYNILDLFSKNAYGLFLYAYLRGIRVQ